MKRGQRVHIDARHAQVHRAGSVEGAMRRRSWVLVAAVLAACGDNSEPASFEIVGHSDVGARGMSSAIAIAGDMVYVGSRNDKHGVAAIDIADPSAPTLVGEVIPAVSGQSSRELRAIAD